MHGRYQAHEALARRFAQSHISRRTFLNSVSALGFAVPAAGFLGHLAQAATPSDTLVIGAPATPTTLDPEFSSSPQDREVDCSTYDRFTEFKVTTDAQGNRVADLTAPPQPLLAESWEISDGGRKYTIKLKEGVKSYFGNELTAEDVKWSWDRVFGLQSQGLFPLGVASIRSKDAYKVAGRYVVEIALDEPNPLLITVQATPVPGAVILDSTEVKKHTSDGDPWAKGWLVSNTASFGPYHAKSFTPGQQVEYVANPNYHRGTPGMERVLYREIPSSATRLTLLKTGAIDVAEDLVTRERRSLEDDAGVHITSVQGNLGVIFGLNNSIEPFTDKRVRQAVAYAMPIEDIINTVYFGDSSVRLFQGPLPDQYPGYPASWPYQPRDAAKAEELLAAAGKSSFTFDLSYSTIYPEHEQIAQLIRTAMNEIGVEARLQKLAPAKYQEQYYSHQAQSVIVQDAPFVVDGAYAEFLFFGPGKGAVGNWIDYVNPTAQDKIMKALGTAELAQRNALAKEAAQQIVEDVPWPMYLGIGFHMAMRSNVTGLVWRPHNLVHLADLRKT
jgi:peptide/nickel transport system substrate-binding protein